jgi:hypothetical protein
MRGAERDRIVLAALAPEPIYEEDFLGFSY